MSLRVLGVDGARRGWVGACLHVGDMPVGDALVGADGAVPPGTRLTFHFHARLDGLLAAAGLDDPGLDDPGLDHARPEDSGLDNSGVDARPDAASAGSRMPAVVAVDMPIGLAPDGRRACDRLVRPLLGPRRASLFEPPPLDLLDAVDHATANAAAKERFGRGISKQAWFLVPKIREVRALAEATAGSVSLFETFPELGFAALAGEPLAEAKSTWTGLARRIALLADVGLDIPADVGAAGATAPDDVVDATVLAWSALRIATGCASCRPTETSRHGPRSPTDGTPTIWW